MTRLPRPIAGICALLAATCLSASAALAQPPDYEAPAGESTTVIRRQPPAPAADPQPRRDPTMPSPSLREAIEATQTTPQGPGAPLPALPPLSLKARIVGKLRDPVALLGLGEKGSLVVHAGREYPLALPGGGGYTLHVLAITPREVEVEVLPLKRRYILQ